MLVLIKDESVITENNKDTGENKYSKMEELDAFRAKVKNDGNTDITGSNAFLLSSDLATLFTGRIFEIKVYPFAFDEYVEYFQLKDRYEALDKYVLEGGMAGSYLDKVQEARYDYIADVFNTLIVRDIRKKYKIRNTQFMDRIVDSLWIMYRIFLLRVILQIHWEVCTRRYIIQR